MKQTFTLFFIAMLCFGGKAFAQCSSPANNYDLIVVSNITISPQTTSYMQGYVCNGGILLDSAMCCTRIVNIDSGGAMYVGPNSYGMAYVKSGGVFNGANVSNNWQVYSEPGATVINHTGPSQSCAQITFNSTNCIMGFAHNDSPKPNASLIDHRLTFAFASVVNNVTIEVFDVSGNVVRSEQVSQTSVHSMDLSGLAGGVYMYRVSQAGEVISSDKVVLQ